MKMKAILNVAVLLMLAACSKVPSGYQGQFVDSVSGAKLELSSDKGKLSLADGRSMAADIKDYKFEDLAAAKAGFYITTEPNDKGQVLVYWVTPNAASRQEAAGLVWFDSEVVYSRLASKTRGDVKEMRLMYCAQGQLLLDMITKRIQTGCPAGAQIFEMRR